MSTESWLEDGTGPSSASEQPRETAADLCLTCMHLGSCVYRDSNKGPVSFCEMFEAGPVKRDHLEAIIDKHCGARGGIIGVLEAIQAKYGFLPEAVLRLVAEKTGRSMVDLYGVATFYKSFSLKPRGKHLISVCLGTACHVRNAPSVAKEFQRQLGVDPGDTTADGEFTLETVACLGACALGPIVVVDGHYFSQVSRQEVSEIIEQSRKGLDWVPGEEDRRVFPVEVYCARCNHSLMEQRFPVDGYPAVQVTISFGRTHCWLRLSSLYGSYNIESEVTIPPDTVVNFFCPHCHAELIGAVDCVVCGAPMVPMLVRGGGMIQICSRRGCKSHMLDLSGVNF